MLRPVVLAIIFQSAFAQQLHLATNYSGSNFFNLWDYMTGNDATNFWGDAGNEGNVNWTSQAFAEQQGLLTVNSVGNVIIRVDNFTSATPGGTYGRNSLQMLSKQSITPGDLVILDAIHMPFGCSVWPSFWMSGGPNWPEFGEIDVVENVNLATTNAFSLHTEDGCMASKQVTMTGSLVSTDCFNQTNGDQGCVVDDRSGSFGSGFAKSGGGVFATLWNDTGILIWSFTRSAIPSDLATANPNPGGWGAPTAFYPSTTCNTNKFFGPQTMIIEIDICGNFAVDVFNQTCSGVAAECVDLVTTPSNYDDAYFEIRYLTVFSNSTTNSSTTGGSSTGGSSTGASSPSATSTTSGALSMNALGSFSGIVVSLLVLLFL